VRVIRDEIRGRFEAGAVDLIRMRRSASAIDGGELVSNNRDLRGFSDQPVAEAVQCGELRLTK